MSICRWREVRGYRQSANWPVSVKPSSPRRPFLLTRLRPLCQCCTHSTNECSVSKGFPWQLHEFFGGSIPITPTVFTYNGLISQVVSKLSILPQHLDELNKKSIGGRNLFFGNGLIPGNREGGGDFGGNRDALVVWPLLNRSSSISNSPCVLGVGPKELLLNSTDKFIVCLGVSSHPSCAPSRRTRNTA